MAAFRAHFDGTYPALSASHPAGRWSAGALVFYLVALLTGRGRYPVPAQQLTVSQETSNDGCDGEYETRNGEPRSCGKLRGHAGPCGWSQDVTETVTETARGRQGRRWIVVATRRYSYRQRVRGAKAAARDAARWSAPDGSLLRIWSNIVPCDVADSAGFHVPGGETVAQRGRRAVGREDNAQATIRGNRAVVVAAPAPGAPVAPEAAPVSVPAPVVEPEAQPVVDRLVAAGVTVAPAPEAAPAPRRILGRLFGRQGEGPVARPVAPAESGARVPMLDSDPAPRPALDSDSGEGPDPSVVRFRLLDLD